jgi:hypothetical protein
MCLAPVMCAMPITCVNSHFDNPACASVTDWHGVRLSHCLTEVSTMRYQKHFDHWTVLYPNGHRAYFKSEEVARAEAVLYGIGLVSPLYA